MYNTPYFSFQGMHINQFDTLSVLYYETVCNFDEDWTTQKIHDINFAINVFSISLEFI